MKKSLLLLIVVLLSVALYAASASALVITHDTEWGIDCDQDTPQDLGSITMLQSYPGEFNTYLDYVLVQFTDNSSTEDPDLDAGQCELEKEGTDSDWDPENDLAYGVGIVPEQYVIAGAIVAGVPTASVASVITEDFSVREGFTVRNNDVLNTTGDGDAGEGNCEDDNCIVTADVDVTYVTDGWDCPTNVQLIVGISASKPDLCSTTLKFPYVVASSGTAFEGAYISALVVTNNASTTCVDNQSDNVNFYAWDEAGNYKGRRGPYKLLKSGQVVIVVDDIDDGVSTTVPEATAEFLKDTTFANGWFDSATSTFKPWMNADGQASGRGQVIAIANQNYSEGFQFLFSVADAGITGLSTNLALKDLTNYSAENDWNYGSPLAIDDEEDYDAIFGWDTSDLSPSGDGGFWVDGNTGIISIDSTGDRVRGFAGLTDAYYH